MDKYDAMREAEMNGKKVRMRAWDVCDYIFFDKITGKYMHSAGSVASSPNKYPSGEWTEYHEKEEPKFIDI